MSSKLDHYRNDRLVNMEYKIFGAALDALDLPEKVDLKIAYLNALKNKRIEKPDYLDPYEAISKKIKHSPKIKKVGKFEIASWLTPKPLPDDLPQLQPSNFTDFFDINGYALYSNLLENYIEKEIFPASPVMIGVDHSLSGGAIRALSIRYKKEKITTLVLDAHFDAIPLTIRKQIALKNKSISGLSSLYSNKADLDLYNCGNFIDFLLKERVIMAKNLIILGVCDYPEIKKINRKFQSYNDYYFSYKKAGVKFIPQSQLNKKKLSQILDDIQTEWIYLSVDMDVCAGNSVQAIRFFDSIGISNDNLLAIAEEIRKRLAEKQFKLAGLDVMEIDTHLLDIKLPDGGRDKTSEISAQIIENLLML